MIESKTCTKCHQELLSENFYACKTTRDGLGSWCKNCLTSNNRKRQQSNPDAVRQYNREYRARNHQRVKEKAKERSRNHYLKNKESVLARTSEYRKANPEVSKRSQAKYYANNREKRIENTRRYHEENPEKGMEQSSRHRARQQGVEIGKVDYRAIWERDGGVCHICGGDVPANEKGFDHVIPIIRGGAHTMENIKVCHRVCNSRKSSSLMNELDLSSIVEHPVSGYTGVVWAGVAWSARLKFRGQTIHLGSFDSPEEAALVWDNAAIQYRGESTKTNFPYDPNRPIPKTARRSRARTWQEKVEKILADNPLPATENPVPSSSHTRAIPLTQGKVAIVDEQDYERIVQYNWSATKCGDRWYASRSIHGQKRKKMLMHRFILDAPDGMYVDHLNSDGLLNTRANLRLCTSSENARNRGKTSKNTTGFKGVFLNKSTGRWVARINVNGVGVHLGTFDTKEEAATVYDEAAKMCHGQFARTNREEEFPTPPTPVDSVDDKRLYISNSSGYRGVHPKPGSESLWVARIRIEGKGIHVGIYDSPEKAARAWDAAARKYRGNDTPTNFPDGGDDDELLAPKRNPYHNKHGFMGVSQTNKGAWMANIQVNGQRIYLGLHDTPEAAARAWDQTAIHYRGPGTKTNFPQE